jgi:hypothetical protein
MYEITASMTNDEDFDLTFQVVDDDDEPRDITGWTFEFVLNDPDGGQLFLKTSDDPEIVTDPAESTISIVFDNAHFAGLDPGTYRMGCRYTDTATGRTKQLFVGDLSLIEGHFT